MKSIKSKIHSTIYFTTALSAGLYGAPTYAEGSRSLEEVVVTAQKRAESLQDVPIAISVVTGEDMASAGIQKMENLAPTIPNLHISEGFGTDQMFIRGIGSGVQFGFEQSVGTIIDGIYYGRSRFSRVAFLDTQRVEVLKGPQGAILGKNTSGGAINITSTKPTDEFEAWLAPSYEFDGSEGYTVEGAISGPLTENLRARLTARVDNHDGYLKNTFTGKDDQSVDDKAARLTIVWDAAENLDVTASYSYGDLNRFGRNIEITSCTQEYRDILAAANKSQFENCKLDGKRSSDALFGLAADDDTAGPGDGVSDLFGPEESQDTAFELAGLTVNWDTPIGIITSVSGWAEYDYHEFQDGDRGPIDTRSFQFIEDYSQFSQEFRLTTTGETVDYMVGIFYQKANQFDNINLNFQGDNGTATTPGFPPPAPLSSYIYSDQDTTTKAIFGQLTWHLSETFDLVVDGRYTKEEKEINQRQELTPVLQQSNVFLTVYDVDKEREENNFSPSLSLKWTPDDDSLYYASVRSGFKGGGYDFLLNGLSVDPNTTGEFEEEEVLSYELGTKLTLLDGSMQLNGALFYTQYDDLQLGTLVSVSSATFVVGNAAKAVTQGVEIDLKWRATEHTTITALAGLLNAEYDDYSQAPCFKGQTATQGCVTTGAGQTQDLTGETLLYSPDFTYHINVEHVWPIGNLELVGNIGVTYSSSFRANENNDPRAGQDSYEKYDASLKLTDGEKWEVAIIGRNLTDELTTTRTTDLPLTAGGGNYFSLVDAPRQLIIQTRYNF